MTLWDINAKIPNMEELVNVIVPCYNVEKYVGACVKSIIEQDYKNLKIYLVNDCSTDKTLDILQEFAKKDGRVKVVEIEKNSGPANARNVALDQIEGEFFIFVDSDDRLDKNHVSTFMQMMDDECVFVASHIKQEKRNDAQYPKKPLTTEDFSLEQAMKEIVGDGKFSAFSANKMFRRSVCKDLRFNPNIMLCEDTVFCLNYLHNCKEGKVRYTNQKTYHYFRTKGSLSMLGCSEKKFEGISHLKQEIYALRDKNQHRQDFVTKLDAWWFLMQLQFMLYAKNLKKKEEKKALKQEAQKYYPQFKKAKRSFTAIYRKMGGVLFGLMKMFF